MSVVRGAVYKNSYRDSVELMGMAAELERMPGITRAGLVMATPANLAVLATAGLGDAVPAGAAPSDLIVALSAADDGAAQEALANASRLLASGAGGDDGSGTEGGSAGERLPQTIGEGLVRLPGANLALISTPGTYATAEALKALKHGLNVFLFSDNVPIEDEIELKALAGRKGLLVMGPDCGTAIVGGVPLGFANAVRRGTIGLAAASGTGLQQVACLVHRYGGGISHALGTGGRDLDERVGGATMLAAIERLLADPGTQVLVLISKPPSPLVARRILEVVRTSPKPVVVNFLGGDPEMVRDAGAHPAATFESAARIAVALAEGSPATGLTDGTDLDVETLRLARDLGDGLQADASVLGLYSGGSLAGEAKLILKRLLGPGRHDRILDLGDDEYTVGRPHPMIDPRLRIEHILEAADDPSVGVLLLDVVLGYASHTDPAGALAPAIAESRLRARSAGRQLAVVASVCGTDQDPQGFAGQERVLSEAGVNVAASNAAAASLAASIVRSAASRGTGSGAPR